MDTDSAKVQRFLHEGDRRALEALVDTHFGPTFALAYSLTGSYSESEDLVQETFLRAFQGLSGFRKDGDFGAWLAGIMRRVVASQKKRTSQEKKHLQRRAKEQAMKHIDKPPDAAMKKESREIIEATIERLPESLRVPLILYYYEHQSTGNVAKRLQLTPEAVRKRVQRARNALGHELAGKLCSAVAFLTPPTYLKTNVLHNIPKEPLSVQEGKPNNPDPSIVGKKGKISTIFHHSTALFSLLAATAAITALLVVQFSQHAPQANNRDTTNRETIHNAGTAEEKPSEEAAQKPSTGVKRTIPIEKRASISGEVIEYGTQKPIAGAHVVFLENVDRGVGDQVGATETGSDGRFFFRGPLAPEVTSVHITVSKEGFASGGRDRIDRFTHSLPLIQLHRGRTVKGTVFLEDGRPPNKGIVLFYHNLRFGTLYTGNPSFWNDFNHSGVAEIGKKGSFSARVYGNYAVFLAKVPGYIPQYSQLIPLTGKKPPDITIRLKKGLSLSGSVEDKSGHAVHGARVLARSLPWELNERFDDHINIAQTRTDVQGRFHLEGLPQHINLLISHPHFITKETTSTQTDVKDVRFELEPARRLIFRLEDNTGKTVTGKKTTLEYKDCLFEKECFHSSPFKENSTKGTLSVKGFLPLELSWPQGTGGYDLGTVVLEKGLSLALHVVDENKQPVKMARLWLRKENEKSKYGRSNADGELILGGLIDGEYILRVTHCSYLSTKDTIMLAPSEKNDKHLSRTIMLERGGTLRAVIVDYAHQALEGAFFSVYDQAEVETAAKGLAHHPHGLKSSNSAADGSVFLSGITPRLPLVIRCTSDCFVSKVMETAALENGEVRDLGTIILTKGITVRGIVQTEEKVPIPWTKITLHQEPPGDKEDSSPWLPPDYSCLSNADGSFTINGVTAGLYEVQAESAVSLQKGRFSVKVTESGTEEIHVTMVPALRHKGIVLYEDGSPVRNGSICCNYVDPPDFIADLFFYNPFQTYNNFDSEGRFHYDKLMPEGGPLTVTVCYGKLRKRFQVPSVYELPKRIVLPRGATLQLAISVEDEVELTEKLKGELNYEYRPDPLNVSFIKEDDNAGKGIYSISDIPEGTATIHITDNRFCPPEPQSAAFTAGAVTSVSFQLTTKVVENKTDMMDIAVTNEAGFPVPGAQLYSHDGRGGWWMRHRLATTDNRGTASIKWTEYIIIRAEGYAEKYIRNDPEKEKGDTLSVILEQESVIIVEVIDDQGLPVPEGDCYIKLISKKPRFYRWSNRDIQKGYVRFENVKAGRYQLAFCGIQSTELGGIQLNISAEETKEITFRVPPPFEVYGKVFHKGKPVKDESLYFKSVNMISPSHGADINSEGRYWKRLYKTGIYKIHYNGELITRELTGSRELDLEF